MVSFRKHLTWYFKGIPGAKAFRGQLMTITSIPALDAALDAYLASEVGTQIAANEPALEASCAA